ncbi:hypothetical protein HDU97_005118 [Phlyctochytrium planicorne]|nr:hypothetical protein HDU97_005118 [Phlyctochytrium planicorne]
MPSRITVMGSLWMTTMMLLGFLSWSVSAQQLEAPGGPILILNEALGNGIVRVKLQSSLPEIGWLAIGFGDRMEGSDMIVTWKDDAGATVVSHRQGIAGHAMPVYVDSSTLATPVQETEVRTDGLYTVTFDLDAKQLNRPISQDAQTFIWAISPTKPEGSSPSSPIARHGNNHGTFSASLYVEDEVIRTADPSSSSTSSSDELENSDSIKAELNEDSYVDDLSVDLADAKLDELVGSESESQEIPVELPPTQENASENAAESEEIPVELPPTQQNASEHAAESEEIPIELPPTQENTVEVSAESEEAPIELPPTQSNAFGEIAESEEIPIELPPTRNIVSEHKDQISQETQEDQPRTQIEAIRMALKNLQNAPSQDLKVEQGQEEAIVELPPTQNNIVEIEDQVGQEGEVAEQEVPVEIPPSQNNVFEFEDLAEQPQDQEEVPVELPPTQNNVVEFEDQADQEGEVVEQELPVELPPTQNTAEFEDQAAQEGEVPEQELPIELPPTQNNAVELDNQSQTGKIVEQPLEEELPIELPPTQNSVQDEVSDTPLVIDEQAHDDQTDETPLTADNVFLKDDQEGQDVVAENQKGQDVVTENQEEAPAEIPPTQNHFVEEATTSEEQPTEEQEQPAEEENLIQLPIDNEFPIDTEYSPEDTLEAALERLDPNRTLSDEYAETPTEESPEQSDEPNLEQGGLMNGIQDNLPTETQDPNLDTERLQILPKEFTQSFGPFPKTFSIVLTTDTPKPTSVMPAPTPAPTDAPAVESLGSKSAQPENFRHKTMMRIHGVLMFAAWGICAPVGIIMSRYAREWKRDMMPFHAGGMFFGTVLMTIAGVVVAILATRGDHFDVWSNGPHVIFGLVILIGAVLQPILAVLSRVIKKKHYDLKNRARSVTENVHKWFGRFLTTLAIVNLCLGLLLYQRWYAVYSSIWISFVLYFLFLAALVAFFEGRYSILENYKVEGFVPPAKEDAEWVQNLRNYVASVSDDEVGSISTDSKHLSSSYTASRVGSLSNLSYPEPAALRKSTTSITAIHIPNSGTTITSRASTYSTQRQGGNVNTTSVLSSPVFPDSPISPEAAVLPFFTGGDRLSHHSSSSVKLGNALETAAGNLGNLPIFESDEDEAWNVQQESTKTSKRFMSFMASPKDDVRDTRPLS